MQNASCKNARRTRIIREHTQVWPRAVPRPGRDSTNRTHGWDVSRARQGSARRSRACLPLPSMSRMYPLVTFRPEGDSFLALQRCLHRPPAQPNMTQAPSRSDDTPHRDPAIRHRAPAAERNRDAILSVLARVLPQSGVVLEIASGTGQHAVHCAAALPTIVWQPSDSDPDSRDSIAAWRTHAELANVNAPLEIDVRRDDWGIGTVAAIVCINMIHIAPWEATEALFRDAGARLDTAGGDTCTGRIGATVRIRRRATKSSIGSCGRAIRAGAYATWRRSRPWEKRAALRSGKSWRCRPTTSVSSSRSGRKRRGFHAPPGVAARAAKTLRQVRSPSATPRRSSHRRYDTCSPSHTLANSAPNAGSLPMSKETHVGLLHPIA